MRYLDSFPKPLKDSIIQNRCVPIIGSGFSLNAIIPQGKEMPAWTNLGKAFAGCIPGYDYSNTIDAISAYEHAFSRPVMVEKMKEFLLSGQVKAGATHEAFCRLQFDIVCTTNFDHLLEDGYRNIARPCRPIISESQLSVAPMKDELLLLKFHGDIDHPQTMVATEEDYDKFLNCNPMFATYLSNLLITRTPLFIGYSLDDDDFRQIWQIIKSRLGKMVRQAYVLKVNCSDTERSRYERRGVSVVNVEGDAKDYPIILEEIFREIKSYWDDNTKNFGDNSAMSELALPRGSQTRLCFFSVPFADLPFYKDVVFPIALMNGFEPISADAVVSLSDNWMAKVSSLISKSDFFVIDLSSQTTLYEFEQISAMGKVKDNILIIKDDMNGALNIRSFQQISKKELFLNTDKAILRIKDWFRKRSEKYNKSSLQEPERLLRKGEFTAAVISSLVILEVTLRKLLEERIGEKVFVRGFYELARMAKDIGIIKPVDFDKVRQWISLRNKLVHSDMLLDEETATHRVKEIVDYTNGLKGY